MIAADRKRQRVLTTPEGIVLPLTLASRGARFGAIAIDLTVIFTLMIVTSLGLMLLGIGVFNANLGDGQRNGAVELVVVLWIAAMFLFRNAYFLYYELGPRGATPGKRLSGIRIAARDGGRLSPEMVIARNLLRDIELFMPLVFLGGAADGGDMGLAGLAGGIWFLVFALFPLFNRDNLRAGDVIAGSWVVEAPRTMLEGALSVSSEAQGKSTITGASYRFSDADLGVYGEHELQTLERVLRDNRPEALAAVHDAICRKIGWQPGAGDERAFLEAYYTQLRARLESGMRLGKRKADKFA